MYGLPLDTNFDFFSGKTLQQVCLGVNEVILKFDDHISVTVMSPIGCALIDGKATVYESYLDAAGSLVLFLQKLVKKTKASVDGTLDITFEDGSALKLYDDSSDYESYVIKNGDKTIVV